MAEEIKTDTKTRKTKYRNRNQKQRGYTQIVYPESAPLGWWEKLKSEVDAGKLKYVIRSPIHNQDVINATEVQKNPNLTSQIGQLKKEHWHTGIGFTNPQYEYGASKYLQSITNGTIAEAMIDLKGSVRYMAHLDENPKEKALYNPSDIIAYGISIDGFITEEDKNLDSLEVFNTLIDIVEAKDFIEYRSLLLYLKNDLKDVFLQEKLLKNVHIYNNIHRYITSKRNEQFRREDAYTRGIGL